MVNESTIIRQYLNWNQNAILSVIIDDSFLPPAYVVRREGTVFTGVCLSTGGGVSQPTQLGGWVSPARGGVSPAGGGGGGWGGHSSQGVSVQPGGISPASGGGVGQSSQGGVSPAGGSQSSWRGGGAVQLAGGGVSQDRTTE